MSPAIKQIFKDAIAELEQVHSCNVCNDYTVMDTPEIRKLWQEYNKNNSGAMDESHDQWIHFREEKGKLLVCESFMTFVLKKYFEL
jgi:hypothetical protein